MAKSDVTSDAKALEALLSSLNKSAERLQTLWFSFIGLNLYFMVTALTTTHLNLLLDEAQVLPIINMKVPLRPFYIIGPIFFVVIHFYLLLMLLLLARSAKAFDDELRRTISTESAREAFRMRFENTLFLQLLVGAKPERQGANGWLLATIALLTVAVAPVVTLLVLQMQFLPDHYGAITWLHRTMVGIDVALVFLLWRGYRNRWGRPLPCGPMRTWRERGRWWGVRGPATVAAWSLGVGLTAWSTLVEGRWFGEPPTGISALDTAPRGWLVGIESLFPDRLSLHGATIVGAILLDRTEKERTSLGPAAVFVRTRDFRGRDFTGADFGGADLRGVDFSGKGTRLIRANLTGAFLKGANLSDAMLQGANFRSARMQGALLERAELQGANLQLAKLQGAILGQAEMQGASLRTSRMHGADLSNSKLQGADLSNSSLQGADLSGAVLLAVDISGANLQGADLRSSKFEWANLSGTRLFRNSYEDIELNSVIFSDLSKDDIEYILMNSLSRQPSDAEIDAWSKEATDALTGNRRLDKVKLRFEKMKGKNILLDTLNATFWQKEIMLSNVNFRNIDIYRKFLAIELASIACDAGDPGQERHPYIAQGLLQQWRTWRGSTESNQFRNRLLAGKTNLSACPGVEGFTEADWKKLDPIEAIDDD